MTEKVSRISNPLTIIAIFAALAEINATVSISLVNENLQPIFLWFVILFPTLLVILFFVTLIFFTEVIYAPSDYKDDSGFHKSLFGDIMPDENINNDTKIIEKTLKILGSSSDTSANNNFGISEEVNYLFGVRYTLEKELRRIANNNIELERYMPAVRLVSKLVEKHVISKEQHKIIRNIYAIVSPAVHGEEKQLTLAEIEYVRKVSPAIIDKLKEIN
jgi:hypothetical protein